MKIPYLAPWMGLALITSSSGENIVPAAWKQSNAFNNLRLASNLANATGMNAEQTILYNLNGIPSGEPNNANNISWVTTSRVTAPATLATEMAAGKVWIVADLGGLYSLNSIQLWNFQWQLNSSDLSDRGINQFDVFVRNSDVDTTTGDSGGTAINVGGISDAAGAISNSTVFNAGTSNPWTLMLENQTIARAPNNDTYTGANYTFPANTQARFIAIRVDSSHGSNSGIALGKLRIDGTALADTSAPVIATRTPVDNATNVAITSNIVATFNENILAGTGFVRVRKSNDDSVVEAFNLAASPAGVTISSNQITIDLTNDLQSATEYYVEFDNTAIKDQANNFFTGIADKTTWNFTTDSTAPTIATVSPLDNATNAISSANLVATFSETIKAGTGNITLLLASDDSIVETFDIATSPLITIASNTLTINPTNELVVGQTYYINVDSAAITDLAGLTFAGISDNSTWNFSTDSTSPVLEFTSPNLPTQSHALTRLILQFDEPVTLGFGNVTIHRVSDNALIETVDISGVGSTAGRFGTISRSLALTPGVEYYVNMPEGVFADLSGNPAPAITGNTAWRFTVAAATPLILENFDASTSGLNGTSADVFDSAITAAAGSSTWRAAAGFLGNGAISGGDISASLTLGSYINSTKGTAAGKFSLTMTISENQGGWISLGFATGNTPSTAQNFTGFDGVATIIYRSITNLGEIDMFGGLRNANGVDGPDPNTGFRTLTAVLDVSPSGGYNGTNHFGTVSWSDSVLGALGSYTYTSATNFNSIAISTTSTGMINSLSFSQLANTNTLASWISGFNVGSFTGGADDFDGDGLGNAIENILGSSPAATNQGLTNVSTSSGNVIFRHTRNTTPAQDITASYEWSQDLINWNSSGTTVGGTTVTFGSPSVITPGTPELVEVTATVSGTAPGKVFARLKAVKNP